MRAGTLSRPLTYQTPIVTLDALRQPLITGWVDASRHRAEVRTPTGREFLAAQGLEGTLTNILTMRYPGFLPDPTGRFLDRATGAIHNIGAAFDPDGRRTTLVVYATRRVSPLETS